MVVVPRRPPAAGGGALVVVGVVVAALLVPVFVRFRTSEEITAEDASEADQDKVQPQ